MMNPEIWRLVKHDTWKTNPISITVKRPGVHSTTIANFPARETITPEDSYAYARMMVCAPEMVELLRRFVGWYSNRYEGSDMVMPIKNQPPEIQDAMRLLEKVTDETGVIEGLMRKPR
jgi:hypothetical protein